MHILLLILVVVVAAAAAFVLLRPAAAAAPCGGSAGADCAESACCEGAALKCVDGLCEPCGGSAGADCAKSGCCEGAALKCVDGLCKPCGEFPGDDCARSGCCAGALQCGTGGVCGVAEEAGAIVAEEEEDIVVEEEEDIVVEEEEEAGGVEGTSGETPLEGLEYPPAALTSNSHTLSGLAHGNGRYVASSSSEYGQNVKPFNAFDKRSDTKFANGRGTTYVGGDVRTYAGAVTTTVGGVAYAGEWLQLQTPEAVRTDELHVERFLRQQIKELVLAGSNDGATWELISRQELPHSGAPEQVISTGATAAYTHTRLIVLQMWYGIVQIQQLRIVQRGA